jgi:hypothetical protein
MKYALFTEMALSRDLPEYGLRRGDVVRLNTRASGPLPQQFAYLVGYAYKGAIWRVPSGRQPLERLKCEPFAGKRARMP